MYGAPLFEMRCRQDFTTSSILHVAVLALVRAFRAAQLARHKTVRFELHEVDRLEDDHFGFKCKGQLVEVPLALNGLSSSGGSTSANQGDGLPSAEEILHTAAVVGTRRGKGTTKIDLLLEHWVIHLRQP